MRWNEWQLQKHVVTLTSSLCAVESHVVHRWLWSNGYNNNNSHSHREADGSGCGCKALWCVFAMCVFRLRSRRTCTHPTELNCILFSTYFIEIIVDGEMLLFVIRMMDLKMEKERKKNSFPFSLSTFARCPSPCLRDTKSCLRLSVLCFAWVFWFCTELILCLSSLFNVSSDDGADAGCLCLSLSSSPTDTQDIPLWMRVNRD